MNFRALALGVAFGFLIALSPSCNDEPVDCGPATCDGCCSADNVCTPLNETDPDACGSSGAACVECSGSETCSNGQCNQVSQPDSGTDAGTDGGSCNATTCPNGCCDLNGACRAGASVTNCGGGGNACTACGSGEQCIEAGGFPRDCVDPSTIKRIGSACNSDAECQAEPSMGPTAICKQTTSSGNAVYGGGYCTKPCTSDAVCGNGAFCPSEGIADVLGSIYGEADRFCMDRCANSTECRAGDGMGCITGISPSSGACWLSPLPERDAGTPAPAGVIGKACTADTECGPPPTNAVCIPAQVEGADGAMVPTDFPGGACSVDCTNADAVCGTGGICLGGVLEPIFDHPSVIGGDGCLPSCDPRTNPPFSTCREDYICIQLVNGSTGQPLPGVGACIGSCAAPGAPACGQANIGSSTQPFLVDTVCEVEGTSQGSCELDCTFPVPLQDGGTGILGCPTGLACVTEGELKGLCRTPDAVPDAGTEPEPDAGEEPDAGAEEP